MTAESLKPFLNLPNATATDLKAHCAQKSSVKRFLSVLGCILLAALCAALIGVQIWHLNQTAALQREVDDLKLQLQLFNRASEFNDYEFDNELFANPDEYDTGYEPELDLDLLGEREASELLESGLASSGMLGEDEEDDDEEHRRTGDDLRRHQSEDDEDAELNDDDDDDDDDNNNGDDVSLYETEDISVTAAVANGKRSVRSISGVTHQGVPIVDEPYVPRRNRTRRPHRIYEQLRQRPEELVTPPTTAEMFRWDMKGRSENHESVHRTTGSEQQRMFGTISIRPIQQHQQQPSYQRAQYGPSTPMMPVQRAASSSPQIIPRPELHPGNPTKAPAQILNRMSRVQATSQERHQQTRLPKVISNPGTQKELVHSPEARVRMRYRKAGGNQNAVDPIGKGVHVVKQDLSGVRHHNRRHAHWTTKSDVNGDAIDSSSFHLENDQLIVRKPGLYYIYAQITYDNQYDVNGFNVLVKDQIHLSCTVQTRNENINTCFTAGLAKVETADTRIVIEEVGDSQYGRQHAMHPEKSFFGAFRVGRLPPAAPASQKLQQ